MRLHKKKVDAYKRLKADIMARAGKTALVLEFDYGQNLPLPKLPVNEQFYKRLLWLYVFNVHVHGQDKSYMFHFTEGQAKKGGNSVCSFVRDVIMKEKGTFNEVFLFSDACTGQNRNWVVGGVLTALAKGENITITQVFPVRGHSYCQCDRNFAVYSRVVKKTETIESTDDYLAIIRSSKKSATPFIVQECAVRDFEKYVKIRKPRNLLTSKSVVLQYDRHGNVTSHQNYSLMTPDVVRLSHLSKKKLVTIPLATGVAVAAAKRDDVMSLIRYVSAKNQQFYRQYFSNVAVGQCPSTDDRDGIDSEEDG